TTALGVAAGTEMPFQLTTSKSLIPVSWTVRTSGYARRTAADTACGTARGEIHLKGGSQRTPGGGSLASGRAACCHRPRRRPGDEKAGRVASLSPGGEKKRNSLLPTMLPSAKIWGAAH